MLQVRAAPPRSKPSTRPTGNPITTSKSIALVENDAVRNDREIILKSIDHRWPERIKSASQRGHTLRKRSDKTPWNSSAY